MECTCQCQHVSFASPGTAATLQTHTPYTYQSVLHVGRRGMRRKGEPNRKRSSYVLRLFLSERSPEGIRTPAQVAFSASSSRKARNRLSLFPPLVPLSTLDSDVLHQMDAHKTCGCLQFKNKEFSAESPTPSPCQCASAATHSRKSILVACYYCQIGKKSAAHRKMRRMQLLYCPFRRGRGCKVIFCHDNETTVAPGRN